MNWHSNVFTIGSFGFCIFLVWTKEVGPRFELAFECLYHWLIQIGFVSVWDLLALFHFGMSLPFAISLFVSFGSGSCLSGTSYFGLSLPFDFACFTLECLYHSTLGFCLV